MYDGPRFNFCACVYILLVMEKYIITHFAVAWRNQVYGNEQSVGSLKLNVKYNQFYDCTITNVYHGLSTGIYPCLFQKTFVQLRNAVPTLKLTSYGAGAL